MKILLIIVLCFCSMQLIYSQEDDGVVSLALPIRTSLKFNQYVINPTFSFVRQQNKYVSITNKREWVQFDDAPQTYLVSYSGRFKENIGIGVGLFQQNYGVLTTFGGIVNFAYNARLDRDSNLTFGINVGAYKSGVNNSNIVTNFSDPSLENIPTNFLLSVSPGVNYGTTFLDFGLSINNLVLYNFNSSELIEDNPEQSLQAHIMYTGYMNSNGFFDDSKFSGLIRSEFKKDKTVISGVAMLTIPLGIWAQVGYNNLYGASGGFGLNITKEISIEYNYEKALGDFSDFGPSHEITLAYRFKNKENYDYSSDDEVSGLISTNKKRQPTSTKSKTSVDAQAKLLAEQKVKDEADAQAKLLAEQKAKDEADTQAKLLAEQKIKDEADAQAKLLAEQKAKDEADAQTKLLAEQKAKEDLISDPKDEIGKSMMNLTKQTEESKTIQNELLKRFDEIVEIKDKDLKDLKEENDLSEQGIAVEPKPFKSITEENKALEAIKSDLDEAIKKRNQKIEELKSLYEDKFEADTITNDVVYLYYRKTLKRLELEQQEATALRETLEIRLEKIKIATEFERRRRIKRAAFDNEEERYSLGRASLLNIKKTTSASNKPLKPEDFDFGEEQSSNIQILKNVKNVENGYYLIVAVHNDVAKRDEFLTKIVAAGRRDVDFFYDVKTSKYFIYYKKFDFIEGANDALKSKGSKPYNSKLSIVKIEN